MTANPVLGRTQPEAKVPDRLAEAGVAEGQSYVMERPPRAQAEQHDPTFVFRAE
jgi:hypothetical protein